MEQSQNFKSSEEPIINNDPLQELDSVIRLIRGENTTHIDQKKLEELALCYILTIAGYVTRSNEDIKTKALEMLDRYQEIQQKKLVAVCFLRLLPEPKMELISSLPWRPKVVTLFDSQFADDLYKDRQLNADLLAHEKINRLAEIVKDYEKGFFEALQLLTSLDRIHPHRQKLMSVINNKIGRILIHPFLPDPIEALLDELYTRVESYIHLRDDLGVVDAHKSAIDEVKKFVNIAEAKGTLYSHCLANNVGQQLLELLGRDFASNKVVQPASILVEAFDKKYPLHLVGQEITLGVIVKNQGPGYAYNTRLTVLVDKSIKPSTEEVEIGRLAPTAIQSIEIPSVVLEPQQQVYTVLHVAWHDYDGASHSFDESFALSAQRSDVDWDLLAQRDPYSLEPVATEQELVGRKDSLNRLIGTARASRVGSSIIQGQKRVGKTSLAKALQSHLERLGCLVVYLEAGDYVEPNATATLARLGTMLCIQISNLEPKVAHINLPGFDEALSPLAGFLDKVTKIVPDRPIIIILDEFDELPLDLYTRGPLGDAFFLTLRSISSRQTIGFILVGGEKMALIMDHQGYQLNKWVVIPVDYFTRESDWTDYKELVQRPVSDALEYTEDALIALHDITAGNPYLTKLVCQYVFRIAINRRDCHITRTEVDQGIDMAVRETSLNTFQHFWEDGIFETGGRATEKSIRRRKILIALADVLAKQSPAQGSTIAEHPMIQDITAVSTELKEFVTRKVLVGGQDETYDFKVRLFHQWLRRHGIHEVIATFSDLDRVLQERKQEEQIKIQASEIVALVKQWGMYKGQAITEDKVRAWLEQFSSNREQRTMFTLLQGLRFYSNEFVRRKMAEVDGIVKRGLVHRIESGKLKRSDIVVSYLDSPAKSGAHFARLYVDEAKIYASNVVEKSKLLEILQGRKEVQALVFVDDFVGTGQSALEYLQELDTILATTVNKRNVRIVFVAIVAFIEGWQRLEKAVESLNMPVSLHACEVLEETAKCFSEQSGIFTDPDQREAAKAIALKFGKTLEKNCPLGYGHLEMAVVFERGCPNNSLPILWSESTTPKWLPLFKRL